MYKDETIAAVSTPPGTGGISIIRVSGEDSIYVVNKIFKSLKGKDLRSVKSHTIHYGYIYNTKSDNIIDEVLVSVMKAPNTFTKENIVEVNCHGGIICTNAVLEEIIKNGARLAEPGEFTKRAFLNGRIDLAQAEAVIDVINSKTKNGLNFSVNQLEGNLSNKINSVRNELVNIAAHIDAVVDFPEEDIESLNSKELIDLLQKLLDKIDKLLKTSDTGRILKEGINTVIVGKPNVGKSSLLNALVRENRAIVSEIPGTTRDVIEEYINIKGIPLKIIDTAGIRKTNNIIEKIGVEKSKSFINKADLVILVLDNNQELSDNDKDILHIVKDRKLIIVINKIDLDSKIDYKYVKNLFKDINIVEVSVKNNEGIDKLEETIKDLFFEGKVSVDQDVLIMNMRHKESLINAAKNLQNAMTTLKSGIPIDFISIDLRNAIESLGNIVGLTISEEIINSIFEKFCLGK